jgi:hypothetical protein
MKASIEKPDGTYEMKDMGNPVCGEDFCDGCGDCLHCYEHSGDQEYCRNPMSWVIYINDEKNPYNPDNLQANK